MKKKRRKAKSAEPEIDIFDDPKHRLFGPLNTVLALMTLLSVGAIALETIESLHNRYSLIFLVIEWTAVVLFSAEYLARLFTNKKPLSYVFSFFGIIDLVAILPSFLGMTNLTFLKSARAVRIIRLLRMLRLAKVSRAKDKEKAAKSVYKINLEIYFITLTLAVLMLGSLFYVFEQGAKDAQSIPAGMYWALRVILGGVSYPQAMTLGGTITLILARFTSMILLGMMMSLVGTMIRKLLIGAEKDDK